MSPPPPPPLRERHNNFRLLGPLFLIPLSLCSLNTKVYVDSVHVPSSNILIRCSFHFEINRTAIHLGVIFPYSVFSGMPVADHFEKKGSLSTKIDMRAECFLGKKKRQESLLTLLCCRPSAHLQLFCNTYVNIMSIM